MTSVIMAVVNAVHGHEGEVTGLVHPTQVQHVQEAPERGATLLLGIEGLAVARVERDKDGGRVAHAVTDDESASACPSCGVFSSSVKGHALTRPRDLPYGPSPVRLVWRKRRWRCREEVCTRKTFTESLPAVPAGSRLTARLRRECGAGIAERFSCVLAGAQHCRVSWPVAHRAYIAHVDQALAAPLPPVTVLGIDETRRGNRSGNRTRHEEVADGGRPVAHTGIVNAAGTAGLLAHIGGRTAAKVTEWLTAKPDSWRKGITHASPSIPAAVSRPAPPRPAHPEHA